MAKASCECGRYGKHTAFEAFGCCNGTKSNSFICSDCVVKISYRESGRRPICPDCFAQRYISDLPAEICNVFDATSNFGTEKLKMQCAEPSPAHFNTGNPQPSSWTEEVQNRKRYEHKPTAHVTDELSPHAVSDADIIVKPNDEKNAK